MTVRCPSVAQQNGEYVNALQDFQQKRPELFTKMMAAVNLLPAPMPEDNANQFINGYLALIESALGGDLGPRDEYLSLVIPPLKQNGMPLGYVIGVLVGVDLALVSVTSPEHLPWYSAFLSGYAEKFCQLWEAA